MRLDVSVFDKNHQPVRGLTADEFAILENGRPQSIVLFQPVTLPSAADGDARWQRSHGPDVQSNEAETQRVVVIVLDDAGMPFDPSLAMGAKRIANETVRALGPADLAAVVFTGFGRNYNFTTNRDELHRAIDTLVPRPDTPTCPAVPPRCQIDTLVRIGEVLKDAPVGRKVLAYIGLPLPRFFPGGAGLFQGAVNALRQGNVAVYAFDPRGLRTRAANADTRRASLPQIPGDRSLPSLSDLTGGRAVTDHNEPWMLLPDMMRETGHYYLIGYQSANTKADGEYRRIQVRLKTRGLQAFARDGYDAPNALISEDRRTRSSITAPLDVTLANGLPVRGIPLRLQVTGFAGTEQAPGTVAVVTGIRPTGGNEDPGRSQLPIDVVATIFNERWQPVQTSRQTLAARDVTADVPRWFELVTRFTLPPGRYEVRVAAQRGDETGSVFVDTDVPDAGKLPLSMSGLTLAQDSLAGTIATHVLADLLPRVPTAAREFRSTDHVSAFVRLYQGGHDAPVAVILAAQAVDDRDRTVWDTTATLGGDAFTTARTALYTVEVPLARFKPGPHLLTIRAMIGTRIVQKQLLFRIVS